MPIPREQYEALIARHDEEDRLDRRARRRFWVRMALVTWGWAALGLALAAFAFRVTDPEIGRILLQSGQLVTMVGVLGTVWRAIIVATDRGWL